MFFGLGRAPDFVFPLAFKPARIAVVAAGFRTRKNMREFNAGDVAALGEWNPDALVAPLAELLSLAELKTAGSAESLAFSTAIIALTTAGETEITDEDRDKLWNTFGVPVFEQRCASDGRVMARECEVHDGLHITDAAFEILAGEELLTDECECGSLTPRIRRSPTPGVDEASAAD